jgi:hypothetical protein
VMCLMCSRCVCEVQGVMCEVFKGCVCCVLCAVCCVLCAVCRRCVYALHMPQALIRAMSGKAQTHARSLPDPVI